MNTTIQKIIDSNSPPFIWSFRFGKTISSEEISSLHSLPEQQPKQALCDGWETRFFWPLTPELSIIVPVLEPHMFDIRQYIFTVHKDLYIVSDKTDDNLKIRNNEILLKKLLGTAEHVDGFQEKDRARFILDKDINSFTPSDVSELLENAELPNLEDFDDFKLHYIVKESMLTHLKNLPAKIEFSKIYIGDKIYLSLCIESRTFEITDHLRSSMNFTIPAESYVNFLKEADK